MSVRQALAERSNAAFSEFMKTTLSERRLSISALCEKMGVGKTSSFRSVINGKARATPKTIERIALALDIPAAQLTALYAEKRPYATKSNGAAHTPMETVSKPRAEPEMFRLTATPTGRANLTLNLTDISLEDALAIIRSIPKQEQQHEHEVGRASTGSDADNRE